MKNKFSILFFLISVNCLGQVNAYAFKLFDENGKLVYDTSKNFVILPIEHKTVDYDKEFPEPTKMSGYGYFNYTYDAQTITANDTFADSQNLTVTILHKSDTMQLRIPSLIILDSVPFLKGKYEISHSEMIRITNAQIKSGRQSINWEKLRVPNTRPDESMILNKLWGVPRMKQYTVNYTGLRGKIIFDLVHDSSASTEYPYVLVFWRNESLGEIRLKDYSNESTIQYRYWYFDHDTLALKLEYENILCYRIISIDTSNLIIQYFGEKTPQGWIALQEQKSSQHDSLNKAESVYSWGGVPYPYEKIKRDSILRGNKVIKYTNTDSTGKIISKYYPRRHKRISYYRNGKKSEISKDPFLRTRKGRIYIEFEKNGIGRHRRFERPRVWREKGFEP